MGYDMSDGTEYIGFTTLGIILRCTPSDGKHNNKRSDLHNTIDRDPIKLTPQQKQKASQQDKANSAIAAVIKTNQNSFSSSSSSSVVMESDVAAVSRGKIDAYEPSPAGQVLSLQSSCQNET